MEYELLKDIAKITMGQSPSSSSYNENGDGLPFFQGNADFGEVYPTVRIWCNNVKKVAHKDDILVSVRAPIGAVNMANHDCCIGRGLAAITVNKPEDREYIFRLLKAQNKKLNQMGTGSTFKAIGKKVLENIQVPILSKNEKIRAMQILKRIESLVGARKSQLFQLDAFVKARFVEMFGDPCCNQLNWNCKKLSEITSKIGSGATPKGGKESYVVNGVSFVRSLNVYDGNFVYKNLAHLTQEQASQLQNVTLEKDDVLINITGASVARSCIVPNDILPARVNQHVSILRPNLENVNPVFLNKLLISYNFKNKLLNLGSAGGATRQAITKQQLEDLEIILPPIELQNQFESFVHQVDKSKVAIQKSLDETQLLFDSLMQEYFS